MTSDQHPGGASRPRTGGPAPRSSPTDRRRRRNQVLAALATVALVLTMVWGVTASILGGRPDAAATTSAAGCAPAPAPQARPKTFGAAPDPATAAGRAWVAHLDTTCGRITVELDGTRAPQTVASFLLLAREGYWAPSPCHRLTTEGIYVLQCGDPTGSGSGDPGYAFGIENAPADGAYPRGTLAMARAADPSSNGGQFFVVYRDTALPTEGGGYTIFGKVTAGLDIVDRIAATGVAGQTGGDGPPKAPISILEVSVTEKKA